MIRRLGPQDAATYRALRLEGLRDAPTAFGASWEAEMAEPPEWFAARISGSTILGAFERGRLVGTAGVRSATSPKLDHVGHVFGVWVIPTARRRGHAQALVAALVECAKEDGLVCLRLRVTVGNHGALALYRAARFEVYATERASLRACGCFHDEHLMERFLRPL